VSLLETGVKGVVISVYCFKVEREEVVEEVIE
jgi:hypothetical protein